MRAPLQGHERLDQRSLALHRAIAEKFRAKSAPIALASENLDRWTLARGRSQRYWDAWREILTHPLPYILDLMTQDTERMTAMRQATPFAGVLDPKERWAIYEQFEERPLEKA